MPELVPARIVGQEGRAFRAELTGAPQYLKAFRQGGEVLIFRMPNIEKPFLVSETYLAERKQWTISPCNVCGFSELFDPPSEILGRWLGVESPETVDGFSWCCPMPECGGAIVVNRSLTGPNMAKSGTGATLGAALMEFIGEPWGKMVIGGALVSAMGVGLTVLSYAMRNPQDGIFLIYPRTIITGAIVAVFGLVYWRLAR